MRHYNRGTKIRTDLGTLRVATAIARNKTRFEFSPRDGSRKQVKFLDGDGIVEFIIKGQKFHASVKTSQIEEVHAEEGVI